VNEKHAYHMAHSEKGKSWQNIGDSKFDGFFFLRYALCALRFAIFY
jgi:hypothetical protein